MIQSSGSFPSLPPIKFKKSEGKQNVCTTDIVPILLHPPISTFLQRVSPIIKTFISFSRCILNGFGAHIIMAWSMLLENDSDRASSLSPNIHILAKSLVQSLKTLYHHQDASSKSWRSQYNGMTNAPRLMVVTVLCRSISS